MFVAPDDYDLRLVFKSIVENTHITKQELADKLGISRVYLSQLMNDASKAKGVSDEILKKIVSAYPDMIDFNHLKACVLYASGGVKAVHEYYISQVDETIRKFISVPYPSLDKFYDLFDFLELGEHISLREFFRSDEFFVIRTKMFFPSVMIMDYFILRFEESDTGITFTSYSRQISDLCDIKGLPCAVSMFYRDMPGESVIQYTNSSAGRTTAERFLNSIKNFETNNRYDTFDSGFGFNVSNLTKEAMAEFIREHLHTAMALFYEDRKVFIPDGEKDMFCKNIGEFMSSIVPEFNFETFDKCYDSYTDSSGLGAFVAAILRWETGLDFHYYCNGVIDDYENNEFIMIPDDNLENIPSEMMTILVCDYAHELGIDKFGACYFKWSMLEEDGFIYDTEEMYGKYHKNALKCRKEFCCDNER